MNQIDNNNNIFKKIQNFISNNLRNIFIILGLLFLFFISLQTYNYYLNQQIKKNSINFFNSIERGNEIFNDINEIDKSSDIFSTLTSLKYIQQNNEENNFSISKELYKEIILLGELDNLYKSSIAAHASYTLIHASYLENTNNYLNDILFFINNIDSELESYFSIKEELQYLLLITELDLNKSDYKLNSKALEKYKNITNSSEISSSVKERVKKIHEFQLYK